MGIIGYVLIGSLVVTGVYVATIYNNLVRLKHTVTKNWSNIDVLLKQRHDELPNLVETCKAYMTHERETLVAVMGGEVRGGQRASGGRYRRTGACGECPARGSRFTLRCGGGVPRSQGE